MNIVESCIKTTNVGVGNIVAVTTCNSNQVQLALGDNVLSVTPTTTVPTIGADGSLTMTAICDVRNIPGAITNMGFNDGLAGPTNNSVSLIEANLVCTADGWTYTQDGVTTVITGVNCLLGTTIGCGACTATDITFTPMTVAGTADATFTDFVIGGDGCAALTAICPISPNGGNTFMQFNGGGGGPQSVLPEEVTANLICNTNGQWEFTENGVTTIITEVNCLVT
ncbi:hypothetical protein FO519_008675 [Halicephalobus sp. NKZ332]|nr:hypothetical protein FO519_008675 [Halicephalobus sp. NKZ332]